MNTRLPDIRQVTAVVEQVVSTLGAIEIRPILPVALDLGDDAWVACVPISGPFAGLIAVLCSDAFAQRIACAMLEAAPGVLTEEIVRDAVGELAHIVAGNIKSLVTTPSGVACKVHSAVISRGTEPAPEAINRGRACFAWGEEQLGVYLWELDGAPAARERE